jgi:hypothetical protein
MSFAQLTEQERGIVQACLKATCEGPFFPDGEFHARFGLRRAEVYEVLLAWPEIDDGLPTALAVVNAMANLLSYPHGKAEELRRWVPASDAEILRVLHKCQAASADPARNLRRLGGGMSGVSEACYGARWYDGTEYLVPELCRRAREAGTAQPWSQGAVTPEVARGLTILANEIGSWAILSDDASGYLPFDPFPTPPEHLSELDFWRRKRGG